MRPWPLALVLLLVGCSSDADDGLRDAEARWARSAPEAYALTYTVGCFCAFEGEMPYTVTVENGRPVATVDHTGKAVFDRVVTVDSLFAIVREARRHADKLDVTFNPRYGYPSSVSIDWIRDAVDDEVGYTVNTFIPR